MIVSSDFRISVVNGRPRGLEIAHTPRLGSSYTIRQDISFLERKGQEKETVDKRMVRTQKHNNK